MMPRCRFCGRLVSEAWRTACAGCEGRMCSCGHGEALHVSFTARVTPGRTRTLCDAPVCLCRSFTPLSRAIEEALQRHVTA
jgi:hypothetical protein